MKFSIIRVVLIFSFLYLSAAFCQGQIDAVKNEALQEMKAGRYGQAIDLLNRFISARPQEPQGYNLRGLCYEKRAQYEMAVYDFRSARKLQTNNSEINQNLARTTDAWYKLLYNKIEGHKREIAINPKSPINYLEIGKSYKNLGEWLTAEAWYDKYLPMEEASPDEVIRYTEILAKNNHISKGEPILKKYTDNYPTDQRLWSRYGYFELWLGKNKNAIDAFEKALALKPYFKEAMDGLDLARGKGYIYTVNDTSYRYGKIPKGQKQQEFLIDKYYRILKNNPDDNDTRFSLLDELVKYNRIEEAFNQLLIFQRYPDIISQQKFKDKFVFVNQIRDSIYKEYINVYTEKFNKNNGDKDAAIKLSESYSHLFDYDNAIDVLEKYLVTVKEGEALDIHFMLAKFSALDDKYDKAFNQSAILLKYAPGNKDYRLLADQLIANSNAKPEELDSAINDVKDIMKDDPKNYLCLLTMVYLNARKYNIKEAEYYLSLAKEIDPKSIEFEQCEHVLNQSKLQEPFIELLRKRGEIYKLIEAGDYQSAEEKYDEIISKLDNPDKSMLLEYAFVKIKAKKIDKAISIYDDILSKEYDLDLDIERAKLYYYSGDSTKALEEFSRLAEKKPDDFYVNLYLTDSYMKMHEFGKAQDVLEGMSRRVSDSTMAIDSTETATLNLRYKWLPVTGWASLTSGFGNFSLSPFSYYYRDNLGFEAVSGGGSLSLGVNYFLSIGAIFSRTSITSSQAGNRFTTFKGNIFLRFSGFIAGSAGFGTIRSNTPSTKNTNDFMLKYENPEILLLSGSYETNDARIILYSPSLSFNYNADMLRFTGYWKNKSGLKFSGYFTYMNITDGNAANQFQFRVGKEFYKSIMIGYEYEYQNFAIDKSKALLTDRYYSPQDYQSHCLWIDWTAIEEQPVKLVAGGRLGYIPASDFVIREVYADAVYNPVAAFLIKGRVTVGSTYRFDSSYNSVSAYISAYWSF